MSRFSWGRRRGADEVEELLLRHGPEPRSEFLRNFSARFREEGTQTSGPRSRFWAPRLAFSGLTALILVGLAVTGGFQYAATGAAGAYHAVSQAVSSGTQTTSSDPGNDQYHAARCGKNPQDNPYDPTKHAKCPVKAGPKSQNEGNSGSKSLSAPVVVVNYVPEGAVSVDWKTVDGTAKAGSDYAASKGTLTFAIGETAKVVNVPIKGDKTKEKDETFTVVLSNPSRNGEVVGSGTATILNDD